MQWDLAEGGFRNVLDFLASIRVAQLARYLMVRTSLLPMVWIGMSSVEIIGAFANRGIEVITLKYYGWWAGEFAHATWLILTCCRSNFVLSELLIWTKYLQYALQRMYELANEIDEVLLS